MKRLSKGVGVPRKSRGGEEEEVFKVPLMPKRTVVEPTDSTSTSTSTTAAAPARTRPPRKQERPRPLPRGDSLAGSSKGLFNRREVSLSRKPSGGVGLKKKKQEKEKEKEEAEKKLAEGRKRKRKSLSPKSALPPCSLSTFSLANRTLALCRALLSNNKCDPRPRHACQTPLCCPSTFLRRPRRSIPTRRVSSRPFRLTTFRHPFSSSVAWRSETRRYGLGGGRRGG